MTTDTNAKSVRNRVRITTVLVLLALLVTIVRSGVAQAPAQAQGETVTRATLKNGMRVIIVRSPLAPVASVVVNYLVGSNETPPGFPGTAHAVEHMMFRGSRGLSADQLANITTLMGGMFDADTQQVVTQYFFTVPAEDLDVALHIESLRMRSLLATEDLWKQERGAIDQEVAQDLSNPEYVFYTKLLAAMFRGTPYAHDGLGTRPSFQKTSGEMLRQFHKAWYLPNNAIMVIVGDVEPSSALAEVKKLYENISAGKIPERPAVHLQPVKPETLKLTTDRPYGMSVISFRMPGSDSPDFAAAEVLSDVLSSQRGNLYALVPEGKALMAGFSMDTLPKAGIGYAMAAFAKGASGASLVDQVKKILTDELKNGVPPDLVEAAKRQELASNEFRKNSVTGLAMAWSEAVAVEGKQSPDEVVQAIAKVSVDDVNRVARKYLDFDHAITTILTPQPSGKPITAKSFGGKEGFAPKQIKPVKLPKWAEKAARRLTVPTSMIHPVVSTFPNGLKLIVQPESISKTVSVYGHIKNNADLEAPKGQEGVDDVLDQLFSFGTKTMNRIAFQTALDDIAAQESAGTDFSLRVLSNQFDRGVQLLAANELHPALPEPAFHIVRKQLAAAVAGKLESPDYLAHRSLRQALLPKTDPALRQATPQTISALKIGDVTDYYQHVFRPDLTTIVVVGDVTPENAKKIIGKYFGAWKATGPKPATDPPPVPPNKPSVVNVPDASRVQDRVMLATALGINRFNPDYYSLELGNHVLGGGFYSTRLYRDLRMQSGLVYYVSSSFEIGRTRGFYIVSYACDPPNVSKARTIIVQNLKQMRTKPVTPAELRQAKAQLMREIPLSESSVNSIGNGLLSRAITGLPLDEPIRAAHRYLELSAAQVQAAFAKWVRPDDLVQVSQGPAPQ